MYKQSFTDEQEKKLRASCGVSHCIENFLTDSEFALCRKLVLNKKNYPEHGEVSKYWGFGWDSGAGPLLKWLKEKVDTILPNWKLDYLAIQEGITPWKIHPDINWHPDRIPYKVMLLPMDVEPVTGPVSIDEWPETYSIAFHQHNFLSKQPVEVVTTLSDDMVIDKSQQNYHAHSHGNIYAKVNRPYDDPSVEGLQPGYHISEELWNKHFSHMPYEYSEGLTLDSMHQWIPKSVMLWDSSALHCADNFLSKNIKTKRSLMIFTVLDE